MPGQYVDFGITSGAIKTSRGSICPLRSNIHTNMISPLLWEHMRTIESILYEIYATEGCIRLTQEYS